MENENNYIMDAENLNNLTKIIDAEIENDVDETIKKAPYILNDKINNLSAEIAEDLQENYINIDDFADFLRKKYSYSNFDSFFNIIDEYKKFYDDEAIYNETINDIKFNYIIKEY